MSSRLEREIEEILHEVGEGPGKQLRRRWRRPWPRLPLPTPRLTAAHLMLASLSIILLAFLATYFSPLVARYALAVGLGLFALAFALSLRRHRPQGERRWRGRPVAPRHPELSQGLRRWWRQMRRPRARR